MLRRWARLPDAGRRQRRGQEEALSVVVGLQRRHQDSYRRAIERIRDGAAGKIHLLRTCFNMSGGGRDGRGKPPDMREME